MLHNFTNSANTEKIYSYIHDEVYQKAFNKIKQQNYKLIKIDRDSCNYDTKSGKVLQKSDVDSLIHFSGPIEDGIKNVSEKIRTSNYNDLYIEVVSIFKKNSLGNYIVSDLGWGNKEVSNPLLTNTPDYLSYICLDNKNNKYKSLFITDYKKLKFMLFFMKDAILKDLINDKFIESLSQKIKDNEYKNSFSLRVYNEFYDSIIFAKNKNHNQYYYTIGITINKAKLKTLDIRMNEFSGNIKKIYKNKL